MRVTDLNNGCVSFTELELQVDLLPVIAEPSNIPTIAACDEDENGQEVFDLTANNPAILNGLNPTEHQIQFYTSQTDAENDVNEIDNPTAFPSSGQSIFVRIANDETSCFSITTFDVNVNPIPPLQSVPTNAVCDTNNDGMAEFFLPQALNDIIDDTSGFSFQYFETLTDAQNNTNPIPNPDNYQNTQTPVQTIYVLATDDETGCQNIQPITIEVLENPVITEPAILAQCDLSEEQNGFDTFDLNAVIPEITNNNPDYDVQFFLTQAEAEDLTITNGLSSPYTNETAFSQMLFVRVTDLNNGCVSFTELELQVDLLPVIAEPSNIPMIAACDEDENGQEVFDLTANNPAILNGLNPTEHQIQFNTSQTDAENDVNEIDNPTAFPSSGQSIFVRVTDNQTGCFSTASFEINTFTAIINNVNDLNIQACIFPGESASFDLTENTAIALGNQDSADYNITYHLNATDAQNGNNAITDPTDYDNLSNPQDIWLRLDNNAAPIDCFSTAQFTISVANVAPINFSPDPLQVCDADNDGFAEFDLTPSISDISLNNADIDVTFHLSLSDAENNTNPLSSPFINTVADEQTLYFRTEEVGNGCSFTGSLDLEVFATPELDASQPTLSACSVNADTATFDLTDIDEQIVLNGDTTSFDSTYFFSESDALSDTNAIQDPTNYTNTSDPQTLWIRVSDEDNCSSVAAFQLDVLTGAALTVDSPGSLEVCSQQQDALFAQVDLTQLDSAINANPDAPTLVEYFTALSAVDNEAPIEDPQNFNVSGVSTTVFARVVQVETLCVSEVVPIELIINPMPQVDLSAYNGQVICIDAASGEVINNDFSPPVIETGLSDAEFDFFWQRNGEALSTDTSSLTVDQSGDYQVVATNIETGCQFSSQASIEESSVPYFEVEIISQPFSRDPIVEVRNISGSGSFEFRLDDGNWVDLSDNESLRFTDFEFGQHQISGRGLLGCGERVKEFQVIGYRSFFTPNQDGHNDRWNISSLKNQRDALVLIYDRYGKLLYKFRPGEAGWDGTYNGKTLPSNDYWFSVEYTDPRTGKQSIFRGNITLKR